MHPQKFWDMVFFTNFAMSMWREMESIKTYDSINHPMKHIYFISLMMKTIQQDAKTMRQVKFITLLILLFGATSSYTLAEASPFTPPTGEFDTPLDSIRLSDPAILADSASQMYYMTGTGGLLYSSKDLEYWTGPYVVAMTDSTSWMGPHPMIWAAELPRNWYGRWNTSESTTARDLNLPISSEPRPKDARL